MREGVHGARNIKQAIAIGLSKAKAPRASKLPPPKKGTVSAKRFAGRPNATREKEPGTNMCDRRALAHEPCSEHSSVNAALPHRAVSFPGRQGRVHVGADVQARHRSALAAVHTKGRERAASCSTEGSSDSGATSQVNIKDDACLKARTDEMSRTGRHVWQQHANKRGLNWDAGVSWAL